jgi:hypothetical protein
MLMERGLSNKGTIQSWLVCCKLKIFVSVQDTFGTTSNSVQTVTNFEGMAQTKESEIRYLKSCLNDDLEDDDEKEILKHLLMH